MLMESQFGSGLLLQGAHPSIKPAQGQLTAEAFNITRNVYGAAGGKPKGWARQKAHVNFVSHLTFSFLEAEELGTSQPSHCGICKNCSQCSIQAQQMTAREQSELGLVEANIRVIPEEKQVVFEYPHIKDVSRLEDTYRQVMAITIKVEKRLVVWQAS